MSSTATTSNGRHAPAESIAPTGRQYCVKSLAVAAALRACGAAYVGPVVRPDGWVLFAFADDGRLRRWVDEYWADELPPVQPRDLLTALVELRGDLYAAKGEQAAAENGGGR